ncbi:hypothetical protein AB0C68_08285 [Streptomyces tendae]
MTDAGITGQKTNSGDHPKKTANSQKTQQYPRRLFAIKLTIV